MKTTTIFGLLLLFVLISLQACSFRMEKRRYRPGYHIETHGKIDHQKSYIVNSIRQASEKVENDQLEFEEVQTSIKEIKKDSLFAIPFSNKKIKTEVRQKIRVKNNHSSFLQKPRYHSRIRKVVLDDNPMEIKEDNKKRRRAWAWGIGAVGMACGVTAIMLFAFLGSFYAINLIMGGIVLAIGLIFMTIALIIRFSGYKNLPDVSSKVPSTSKNGKVSFIMGIINASLAAIAFVFSFLISPFGIVAFSVAIPVLVSAIIGLVFGLTGLKSPGVKTTLGIVLAALAIILAIVAMIIIFI